MILIVSKGASANFANTASNGELEANDAFAYPTHMRSRYHTERSARRNVLVGVLQPSSSVLPLQILKAFLGS